MKSKLGRKVVYKKYKPSMATFLNEEEETLEQRACEKLK